MYAISFTAMCIFITIIWIISRVIVAAKNRSINVKRELQLLLVYISIVIIARCVYFPMHLEKGHIPPLNFDSSKIFPFWTNLIPIIHLSDVYDGWQLNIIGNILMFVPVGIIWPCSFKKLDSFLKTVLSGAAFTLIIELTQLFFYERCSDIDDMILNTSGVIIGAAIYFLIKSLKKAKA